LGEIRRAMEGVEKIPKAYIEITEKDERNIEFCNGYLTALYELCLATQIDKETIIDLTYRLLRDFAFSIKRNMLLEDENE